VRPRYQVGVLEVQIDVQRICRARAGGHGPKRSGGPGQSGSPTAGPPLRWRWRGSRLRGDEASLPGRRTRSLFEVIRSSPLGPCGASGRRDLGGTTRLKPRVRHPGRLLHISWVARWIIIWCSAPPRCSDAVDGFAVASISLDLGHMGLVICRRTRLIRIRLRF
jgi:hypothetical protein